MRRAAVPLALVTLFVLSCAPLTVPSPRAPSAGLTSPPATPIPTDVPASLPIGALPRIASVERDDVRLTVELDRNPLSIGEPTWATATVTNTGTDDLVWFHDGCAVAVGIGGTLDGVSWRRGAAQTSKALAFKHDALSGQEIEDGTINLRFEPERFVGKTRYGCGDIGHGNEAVLRFDPGATAWQVGLLDHGDHPVVHLLTIDSRTAVVTGFVEREWDFDVDGYP